MKESEKVYKITEIKGVKVAVCINDNKEHLTTLKTKYKNK